MPVGDFLDTNVLIYTANSHPGFAPTAISVVQSGGTVSVQVFNEFASVVSTKHGGTWSEIAEFLDGAREFLTITALTEAAHVSALRWVERYKLQWWDALIVTSALEAGCTRLLTQDMHAGLTIDGRLTVVNPFA